jgi:hypothetical protein
MGAARSRVGASGHPGPCRWVAMPRPEGLLLRVRPEYGGPRNPGQEIPLVRGRNSRSPCGRSGSGRRFGRPAWNSGSENPGTCWGTASGRLRSVGTRGVQHGWSYFRRYSRRHGEVRFGRISGIRPLAATLVQKRCFQSLFLPFLLLTPSASLPIKDRYQFIAVRSVYPCEGGIRRDGQLLDVWNNYPRM